MLNYGCGHGHVYPSPFTVKARCGGPMQCDACARDFVRWVKAEVHKPYVLDPELRMDLAQMLGTGRPVHGLG